MPGTMTTGVLADPGTTGEVPGGAEQDSGKDVTVTVTVSLSKRPCQKIVDPKRAKEIGT